MVEFALVLVLFLLLLFAILELGRAYYTYSTLTNAVREGARYAIVDPHNTAGIKNETIAQAYSLGLADNQITVSPVLTTERRMGTPITVTVAYPYFAAVNAIIPDLTMRASTNMIIEWAP